MRHPVISFGFVSLLFTAAVRAEVTLPSLLSSHMVLQWDMPVPLWGWAAAGEKVSVSFAGQNKEVTADANGNWNAKLDAMAASATPQTLTVKGNNEVKLEDILVGEVWLGSGQSNMQ